MVTHDPTPPRLFHVHSLVLFMVLGSLTLSAEARERRDADKPPVRSVTFIEAGSTESKAAREQRLRRECKGRPNAGACLGFARP